MSNTEKPTKKPILHKVKTIANTKCFNIEEVELEFSNGQKRRYQRFKNSKVKSRGSVLVVPVLEDNDTTLLIYEYGVGTERYELGCVKGKVDKDEYFLDAANRELQEEIGYKAKKLHLLRTVNLAPGYQAGYTYLIVATELTKVDITKQEGDEPEPLVVVERLLSKLSDWCYEEDLSEGRSLAALYLARDYLKSNFL